MFNPKSRVRFHVLYGGLSGYRIPEELGWQTGPDCTALGQLSRAEGGGVVMADV